MRSFLTSLSRFFQRLLHLGQSSSSTVAPASTSTVERFQPSLSEADASRGVSPELRRVVYQATCNMPKQRMHAGQFGSLLRQADPTFSYEKYSFTKLIYLLEAVPDLVKLERVDNPGAAPAYYVRPMLDTRQLLTKALGSYGDASSDSNDGGTNGWVHIDSVMEAIAAENPNFSIQTYGFSHFKTFLESHPGLISTKADNPNYVRLNSEPGRAKRKPLSKVNGTRLASKPAVKSTVKAVPARKATRSIVHLSKFAGFSPEVLNQKVSELAAIALPERWYFGPQPPDNFAYPILKSYLRYTFIRLQHERKVFQSVNGQYHAFNTGLLDKLLRPIFALLVPHPVQKNSWELTFCIPGEGSGKLLVANFPELPPPANYLSKPEKIFYQLSAGPPDVDWHHVIKDNMERLPQAFIAQYAPAGFTPKDTRTLVGPDFHAYKKAFADALDADPVAYRNIVNRIKAALSRTLVKTQINYKTAVPTYYPNINSIDLLLPICLVNEGVADCAIVARQADSGKYIGHTILTLRQAYNNARLICKLDEHWLTRAMTLSQIDFEEAEDDDSEEFESEEDTDESGPVLSLDSSRN
ncbi:MAG: DUF3825 domain-containing protein [Cyanobacteria bacterium J06632_3]